MSKRFKESREVLRAIRNEEIEVGNWLSGSDGEYYITDINYNPESISDIVIWAKQVIFDDFDDYELSTIEYRFTCMDIASKYTIGG